MAENSWVTRVPLGKREGQKLSSTLEEIIRKKNAELSGLALVACQGEKIIYEGYFGRSRIDPLDPSLGPAMDGSSLFRVASISKTLVALAALMLEERGLLALDEDISGFIGFRLRNPAFPERAITGRMLLSHTSTLVDDSGYNFPPGSRIADWLAPGGARYEDGAAFSRKGEPGAWFGYANLNYGVIASAMEFAARKRFDLLMEELVLVPLGLEARFNVTRLTEEAFRRLCPLYRKGVDEAHWNVEGPWMAQVDDYGGQRPASPLRGYAGDAEAFLASYELGSNGTLFSPQGGLRISALELSILMRLFCNRGSFRNLRLLSEKSAHAMTRPVWRWNSAHDNGVAYNGLSREAGTGLFRNTDSLDTDGGDRMLAEGEGPAFWGHHGDAYGFLGGMQFDPDSGFSFLYFITGTGAEPEKNLGRHSSFFIWEEELQEAVIRSLMAKA